MNIERNHNGSITVSTIVRGHLIRRTFYGYTVKEARAKFRSYLLSIYTQATLVATHQQADTTRNEHHDTYPPPATHLSVK
jgi:hypothetical protein